MTDEILSPVVITAHCENCIREHLKRKSIPVFPAHRSHVYPKEVKKNDKNSMVYMTATSSLGTLG